MKILYLSFSDTKYSVNSVYIKGLRQCGVEVVDFFSNSPGLKKFLDILKFYKSNILNADFAIVGFDSPGLVIWLRFFTRKKIIYNAVCSVYERLVISRGLVSKFSPKAFYYWLLDFLAGNFASLVMLESNHQIEYFSKIFKIPSSKCYRAWTGVDEEKFYYAPDIKKFEKFTVIFRGRLLPEAGGEYVVAAAKILEDQDVGFIMHCFGQELPKIQKMIEELKPTNLKLMTEFLSDQELRLLLQRCHLSLGQLSNHERLKRTIPHKAYESLILKLPYLTARNLGVLELLHENKICLACNPADPKDMAQKILWAKNHQAELADIAERGYEFYRTKLTSKILAGPLLDHLSR